jgi:hypothetical protein
MARLDLAGAFYAAGGVQEPEEREVSQLEFLRPRRPSFSCTEHPHAKPLVRGDNVDRVHWVTPAWFFFAISLRQWTCATILSFSSFSTAGVASSLNTGDL